MVCFRCPATSHRSISYADVLRDYDTATLLVDDAHGIGTLGVMAAVAWSIRHCGTKRSMRIRPGTGLGIYVCGTLSKAIGGFGGILPGSRPCWIACGRPRTIMKGPAPMSAAAGATAKALEIVMTRPELRQRLQQNARRLRGGLRALGLRWTTCRRRSSGWQSAAAKTCGESTPNSARRGSSCRISLLTPAPAPPAVCGLPSSLRIPMRCSIGC